MESRSQREFIERIRQEKFGIGTTKSNPLAGMLHEAIVSLSAELYQKDIHFISELLQNAEDNVYGEGVTPSLELVLTRADVAGVGAPATLILFNNEVGFQPQHVEALCAVGMSTKKGKRNSGYIGEKGIGFKSVFLVTRTPYVISNGYRFRFTDDANNEAKIGYVVPEWTEKPTDGDLRLVYGKQRLPKTMIILPLRADKVEPVREQLKQVSPETLLFLSKLRQLNIRQESNGNSLCIIRSDVEPTTNVDTCKTVGTVNLSVGSHANHISEESKYHLVQQQFPVTHRVEQRKEVQNWHITIAFPLLDRIIPGRFNGDIYAFLPSELASGFPFVVNADFLLVSSRETLKFDSPWNIGILSCIPIVFLTAFSFFLQTPGQAPSGVHKNRSAVAVRQAYRYIPVEEPRHAELRKVRQRILDGLKENECVLLDSVQSAGGCNMFCKPQMGRLIRPEFRSILEAAKNEGNSNPAIWSSPQFIVDREVQETYAQRVKILGVSQMTEDEYIEYLKHQGWLLSLSEELYWQVVFFVLDFCSSSSTYTQIVTLPILKYCKEDGSIALASVQEAKSDNAKKIYFSPSQTGEFLSKWTSAFRPWVSVFFVPTATGQALKNVRECKAPQHVHNYLKSVVGVLSVKSYLQQLLKLLPTSNETEFILLTTEFMYQCLDRKDVEMMDCSMTRVPIVDKFGVVRNVDSNYMYGKPNVLLPAHGSMWPKLSLNCWSTNIYVLSDDYIIPPSGWSSRSKIMIGNKEDSFDLQSYRTFLGKVVDAQDIPHMIPSAALRYEVPSHLRLNMTVEQASLLLKWLTNCFNKPTLLDAGRSHFVKSVKETEWLPTEQHGLRRPSSCFESSSFRGLLKSSDVPCIHPSLDGFLSALESLGVVTDIGEGCDSVVNYMLEISGDTTGRWPCSIAQATRFYTYLHKFQWKRGHTRLKIFVPETTLNSTNSWRDKESCVIHNVDGFVDDDLAVLEDWYPKSLLPFFSRVLQVPNQATVERYCMLWMKWRTTVHEISVSECTRVWKVLSEEWTKCDGSVQKDFVANAWVPSKCDITGTFQLKSARDCFIPDDLHLLALFETRPNVHLVWYPDNSEKMESGMNKIYAKMGVKGMSMCVQQEFIMGENSQGDHFIQDQPVVAGKGFLRPGLFRAILGFLARKKLGLPSSERQRLLSSLTSVVEIIITRPLSSSYTISSLSPPVVATEDNVMALWSKKDRKFYCLDKENPILQNSLKRRDFRTQLATAISHGLLSEHPLIADELTEFINVLICSGFESSHVDYELRRKNAKLFAEDEIFLSQLQT